MAALGLVWGLIKKPRIALTILIWIVMLFILANLDALHLPGGGLITNLSVEIMLFIPISVLAGYFIDQILLHWDHLIPKRLVLPSKLLVCFMFVIAAIMGAKQIIPIINPGTILTRNSDLPAIDWINKNIPENETLVINPFAWGYGLYAGMDGGYWISPLVGRKTIPPPVLYGLGTGIKEIDQLSQEIISTSSDPRAMQKFLLSNQVHYVYVGARGGVISPAKLASSGYFDTIYHHNGVWIFQVKP
jgi:hypothetical protein